MRIAVTGAGGFVGGALVRRLEERGREVLRLVRRPPAGPAEARWDPETGDVDRAALEGLDAVVHLAGEGIAEGRWSAERKRRIRDSRVAATERLARALAGLARPPRALIQASAIGFYGDRGDEVLAEDSPAGQGFLPEVCVAWEAASGPAAEAGARVVHLRIGMVLDPAGGALRKMLTPFRLGLGGRLGSGRQFVSWITRDDLLAVIDRVLESEGLRGPVNAVAPEPVRNLEFTQALGRALRRPVLFPMPAFAARAAFGEMADALLLASARVVPRALAREGFRFQDPAIGPALERLLGRGPSS